jgi:hypothetical protein
MFYNEIDKLIYESPLKKKYDPLVVYRHLILHSNGKINDLLAIWSEDSSSDVHKAVAEGQLVDIARKVFDLKPFSEEGGVVDGVVLNELVDYIDWLEKKGQRVEK